MSGSFTDTGAGFEVEGKWVGTELDIGDGKILTCFGKKRSGKSVMGRLLLASYPGDRMVIAANEDDGPFADGETVHVIRADAETMPRKWPEHLRDPNRPGPMTLRVQVDPGSPTFLEDQDAAVGLALSHGNCALLVHEVGLLAPSNRVPAHTRRLLHANRHRRVTAILCGPRPVTVDPLVIAQSDVVYVFETNVEEDQIRIGKTINMRPVEIQAALEELGPHEYLRFDANEPKPADGEHDIRVIHFPALPADIVKAVP